MRNKTSSTIRYPDARLKGIDEFWDLLRNETDWNPVHIDINTLKTLGIARGKETNAIFALEFLGITDKGGTPTEDFNNLRKNFQGTLSRLVRTSYSKIFETIPISRMNQATLVNFFTLLRYSEETAEYQAKLFVKLCKDAGIDLPNVEENFKRARFRKKGV